MEVQAHLLKAANDADASLRKAINELMKGWLVSRERGSELHTLIAAGHTPSTMAAKRWADFLSRSVAISVEIEANSQFFVEEDGLEFEIQSVEITDAAHGSALSALDYNGTTLEAEVYVTAEAHGTVSFSFSKWDSFDRIYDSMGSTEVEFTEPLKLEAIVTFQRDPKKGDLKLEAVEIQSQSITLHYDDLEPDWMREGPDADDPR